MEIMDKDMREYLRGRSKELLLSDAISIDKESISEILNFKPSHLISLPKKELYTCLIALCQYSIYLNSQISFTSARHYVVKKKFEMELTRTTLEKKPKGKNEAERKRLVIDEEESLQKLEYESAKFEAELKMIGNSDRPITELINVLKKILGETDGTRKEY